VDMTSSQQRQQKITNHTRSKSNDDILKTRPITPSRSKSNDDKFMTPIPKTNRQSKSKSPPKNNESNRSGSPIEEKKPIQSKSILGILDEKRKQQQTTQDGNPTPQIVKQNGTTTSSLTNTTSAMSFNTLGFGGQDNFLNLSLATIFSTRIEEEDDRKTKDEDEDDDKDNDIDSSPLDRLTTKQEKPRRPHPFPFTSPSYLKSLEKHKLPPPTEPTTKKRNRKRTRSKKNDRDEANSIRRKAEYRTGKEAQDRKESNFTS